MDRIEKELNSHVLFIYNNLRSKDSTIGPSMLKEIYKHIESMNEYDTITIFIHSKGGNLATGYKIMKMIKEKYPNINTAVIERSCSTGTLMALAGNKMYLSPFALVSSSEPQMDLIDKYSTSVSTALIKNALLEKINNLNPYDIANYISTLKYYKWLCLDLYGEEKGTKIFDYMHRKVDSHQMPLNIEELNKLVPTEYLNNKLLSILMDEHNDILNLLKSNKDDERLNVIKSKNLCSVEQRKYEDGKKITDGYVCFYKGKEENKMKKNPRITAILNEQQYNNPKQYNDGWDDDWIDTVSDWEDGWDDSYNDGIALVEDDKKVRKNNPRINAVIKDNNVTVANREYKDGWENSWPDTHVDNWPDSHDDNWPDTWDDAWEDNVNYGLAQNHITGMTLRKIRRKGR